MQKVEFSTICLNGISYIKHHLKEFEKLKIDWTWHIVEGVASLSHDTAWGLYNGGSVPKKFHDENFLSIDGTTEYLNSISNHPNVKIYRKDTIWDGKIEMVNKPLPYMNRGSEVLLFQIDVDELWTVENINKVINMYDNNKELNCAYYYCYYFLGLNKYVISDNTYGTGLTHWPRTWRLYDGAYWNTHEPANLFSKEGVNLTNTNVYNRNYTRSLGITFEHYAYANKESVEFKEYYYGYKDALSKWEKLQTIDGVVDASNYLDWIKPWSSVCMVDDWKGKN